ncbi:Cyclopropane-fatty-acyl-phospholipid synthase [Segniliparus rotundus DSM 44985]|uniref:Cyclopropane-fatty-acyl-phospholipid synthase n=1 Tax=Segniliparus rotundus (strain ATCC BAA-972 / CDC 1076 / CIP 108378 / DSM 44985 / JCM 13578) TaxID=640132 RepID=D6ZCJ0_SEGRD|nr:class I SAM-dependent methyltransferase [Segniliparus rotundus]ADG97032.1 Cyclopropane-fatty-acyl-phospholipid synthase [Segniliparus rotundus DSM 44985]
MTKLRPFYEDIEAHYDVENSIEFFSLWLDETLGYTCGYWPRPNMTSAEAQIAKFDLALGKLGLEPGMTLLDIGCGWGAGLIRAYEKYDVNVIGLTISPSQYEYTKKKLAALDGKRKAEVVLQGWEEYEGKVDRIVSVGAFEHFRVERHGAFFEKAYSMLPEDGKMLLHCIVGYSRAALEQMGLWQVDRNLIRYTHLIRNYIFPGAELVDPQSIVSEAAKAKFRCDMIQPLGLHYGKTLDVWLENFMAKKDEIIALSSPELYQIYINYLAGSAHYFRTGHINIAQFTLTKKPLPWLETPPNTPPFVFKSWNS